MFRNESPFFRLALTSLIGLASLPAVLQVHAETPPGTESETRELRSYTTLGFLDQQEIWVASALKKGTPPFPHPYLQRYRASEHRLSEEFPLDAATFEGREVSGIYRLKTPDGKAAIGVLSQWQVEQGDEPILHAIEESRLKDNGQKDWVKLATAPCVDVLQLEPREGAVVFHCGPDYELHPKTKKTIAKPAHPATRKPVPFAVQGWSFAAAGKKRLPVPMTVTVAGAERGEISGPRFSTNRFKVVARDKGAKVVFENAYPLN